KVLLEVDPHQSQHIEDDGIAHRVKHLVAGFAIEDDQLRTQHGEMLRHIRLLHVQLFDQRSSCEFAFAEQFENCDARGMRKRLKDVCFELTKRLRHFNILEIANILINYTKDVVGLIYRTTTARQVS